MKRLGLAAALALLSACAAPASYEGLTGGAAETTAGPAKEDAAVQPPRPVAPVSVSFISSSRPRLRWDLTAAKDSKLTGAIVEMARTRDFAKDVKRFEATGSELVVPEDLELGVWFWRLKGAAVGAVGITTSPTWEMVVRGPAAHGSSDMPTRSLVDMNGDGQPDLLVGATFDASDEPRSGSSSSGDELPGPAANPAPTPKEVVASTILFYAGNPTGGLMSDPIDGVDGILAESPSDGPMSIGGGTDFNGDGLSDVVESGLDSDLLDGKRFFGVNIVYASGKEGEAFDYDTFTTVYLGGALPALLPSVREAADIDGDGYGDAVVGLTDVGLMLPGSKISTFGPPALLPIYPTSDGIDPPKGIASSRVAIGGFDANGDGLGDVLFSLYDEYAPTARALAVAGDRTEHLGTPRIIEAPDTRLATAFAAGDFNGDGIDDIAMTTPTNDSSKVCIWYGNRDQLIMPGPCVKAPAGDAEFGASLTAADLEGDGVDELLATAKANGVDGVRVVRIGANEAMTAAPVGVPGLGVRLTTIWPGRPGKARWAAVAADGSRVGVFEGTALRTSLPPAPGVVRGFGRGIR